VAERLVAELPGRVRWTPSLGTEEVARVLDAATVLVLPSRSEGLPRIVVEAFCRGRAVVAARSGGIPDLVSDGENGLLVPAEDPNSLADALLQVLSDSDLAERLGAGARRSAELWLATPEEYAQRVRELVDKVVDSP
jgi:glycosyltransferase involved in cell wall biosynthesis